MSLKETIMAKASVALLHTKKHSPKILMVAGTVSFIATIASACKATTKIEEVLEEPKKNLESIEKVMSDDELRVKVGYSDQDRIQDLTKIYIQTGWALTKLYAPTIILGSLTLACFFGSHNILSTRNAGLAAAYATLDKGFKEYRGRVVDKFGKNVDKELLTEVKAKEVELKNAREENNDSATPNKITASGYARFFDESCPDWKPNPEYNLMFIKMQESHANDLLKAKRHLFLNEVYDMLGIPRTAAGQQVGWIYDEGRPLGDNYVDFGLYDINNEQTRDFVNGYNQSVLLDFNVDGVILDYL